MLSELPLRTESRMERGHLARKRSYPPGFIEAEQQVKSAPAGHHAEGVTQGSQGRARSDAPGSRTAPNPPRPEGAKEHAMPTRINAVIITASDACSRGERKDESGGVLVQLLRELGAEIVATKILSDDLEPLAATLREFADRADVNLIVTTGGTGFSPRDNTPEATQAVIEREAPGLAEAMRMETLKHTPMAMISRGVCGIRSSTLIINLPGSPKGVRESFTVIKPVLSHAVALLAGKTTHEPQDNPV